MNEAQKEDATTQHNRIFQKVIHFVSTGYCDMLILDELCSALETDLIERKYVEDFLDKKPENIEVIITGRNPPNYILDKADYITEMKAIKHPFEKGVPAREGIEY